MTEVVLNFLKHICNISNSYFVCNAEGLLCRREEYIPVDWTGKTAVRIPPHNLKFLINFKTKCPVYLMKLDA